MSLWDQWGQRWRPREAMVGEVAQDDLARWLVENGLAEDRPGYGHVDGAKLAERLLEAFEMRWRCS